MSTYIMTDIHGHYDAMKKMLQKIGFSAGDRLICAGDYIDRGPQSYEMLQWIENPGENVILIRGNHDEEYAYYMELMKTIFRKSKLEMDSRKDTMLAYKLAGQILSCFDSYGTVRELIWKKGVSFVKLSLWADCIKRMGYFYEMKKNGRRCVIVHAGYIENLKSLAGVETDCDYGSLEDFYLTARDDAYLYGGVEHGMIIAGHTPTTEKYELPFNHGDVYRFYDEDADCIFYDLDCGYAWKDVQPDAKLACLRLEDEKVFYITG